MKAIPKALNPGAKVQPTTRSHVPLPSVLNTGLFDYGRAETSAGWIREQEGVHTPQSEEFGISSCTYRARAPFDALKPWDFVNDDRGWQGILRPKGFFWVAADAHVAYELAQAGEVNSVSPTGTWWAAVPSDEWGHPERNRPDEQDNWDEHFGDRSQTLVFIGQDLREAEIRTRLDACPHDDSVVADQDAWEHLTNPFPSPEIEEAPEEMEV